jgi:general secretion pathway protein F
VALYNQEPFDVSHLGPANSKAMGLDAFVALNDELAALVRAGVPLDQGLTQLARDLPGRMGPVAKRLGDRLAAGESLEQAIRGEDAALPPVWRAVVTAGLRSGRLAVALEGLSTTGRRIGELRRAVGWALVYPLVVAGIAYGLFLFTAIKLAPVMLNAFEDLTSWSEPVLATLVWLGQAADTWAVWPPLLVVAALVYGWYRAGRVAWRADSRRGRLWLWPALGSLVQDGRLATFSEVLALLVRQQVPLDEALTLAADASGDRGLQSAARDMAENLRRGGEVVSGGASAGLLPPLVAWLLTAGASTERLSETLGLTAATYRQRAERTVNWALVYLPILLTAAVGGTATLIQALAVFLPLSRLWFRLGLG